MSVIRPFQRALTALLPHQGNTRVLIPNRQGSTIPLFGYRFDGATMYAQTTGGFVPGGFPFTIACVAYAEELPEAAASHRVWTGLTDSVHFRQSDVNGYVLALGTGTASTRAGGAIERRMQIVGRCSPEDTILSIDGVSGTVGTPADIGSGNTGLTTLAANIDGTDLFFPGWVSRVLCIDRSPLQNRIVPYSTTNRWANTGTLANASAAFIIEFDWVRQEASGTGSLRILGNSDETSRIVLADTGNFNPNNFILVVGGQNLTIANALEGIAIGQSARYRVEKIAPAGPAQLFIDGRLVGATSPYVDANDFELDQLGSAGGTNPFRGGLGNIRLQNLTTGEEWFWPMDEASGNARQVIAQQNVFVRVAEVGVCEVVENNGVYTCTGFSTGANRADIRGANELINLATYKSTVRLKALPGEAGKDIQLQLTRTSGGAFIEETQQVTLTDEYQDIEIGPLEFTDPLNQQVSVRLQEGISNPVTGCVLTDPRIELSYDGVWNGEPDRVLREDRSVIWPCNEGTGDQFLAYDGTGARSPGNDMTIVGFNENNWQRVGEL
jgi:hypothetical protein